MIDALQQIAFVEVLLANWDAILMRIGTLPPSLANDFAALGPKLQTATDAGGVARLLDELVELARGTPASIYVRELIRRSTLESTSQTREAAPAGMTVPGRSENGLAYQPMVQDSARQFGALLAQPQGTTGVVRVPVLFATDRKPVDASCGSYLGEPDAATRYGVAWVTIPAVHKTGQVESPAWWNKLADPHDEQKYFTLAIIDSLDLHKFLGTLESTVLAAESAQILVFLHGFNVTFEEAAMRAAQFAQDTNFPGIVLLYSWPSAGGMSVRSYAADEERSALSADALAGLLTALQDGPWKRVHILAHSMGNRVLLGALADNLRPKLTFGQLVFAAADVYLPEFEKKFPKLQTLGRISSTAYTSKKDRALWLSRVLHRSSPRLGLFEDRPCIVEGLETIDATAVSTGWLAHGYWSDQRALMTDLQSLLLQGLNAKDRRLLQVDNYWAFAP